MLHCLNSYRGGTIPPLRMTREVNVQTHSKLETLTRWMAVLCLIALFPPVQAHAQPPNPPFDATPDQSVGVLSEDPGYGERWSATIFPFGNYTGTVSGEAIFCRTYLHFPLDVPAGSVVQSATLFVFVDDYWPGPGSAPMSVYPVTTDWTVEGVDWYDMGAWPALDGAVATTVVSSDGGWFPWDVTGLVREWVSGARSNYGLALAAADLGSTASNWAAARRLLADEPGTRPHLFVSYITPTATPGGPPPTAVPQPTLVEQTATPQPAAPTATPVLTPTPIPILLPETGALRTSLPIGLAFVACGLLLLLTYSRLRRR